MKFNNLNYNNFVIDDVLDAVSKHHKKKKKKDKKKQNKSMFDICKNQAFLDHPDIPIDEFGHKGNTLRIRWEFPSEDDRKELMDAIKNQEVVDLPDIPIDEFGYKGETLKVLLDFSPLGENFEDLIEDSRFDDVDENFHKYESSDSKKSSTKTKKSKSKKKDPLLIG